MLSVFDLDHTLLKTNCCLRFGRYLYRERVFSRYDMVHLFFLYFRHKILGMSIYDLHHKSLKLVKGVSLAYLKDLAERFVEKEADSMVNQKVWKRLCEAKELGHKIIIVSNSPDFLVKIIANRLNVDIARGIEFELDDSCELTTPFQTMEGEKKKEFVYQEAEKYSIRTEDITAYSDSHLDIPLLNAVGKAVGVNPDCKLHAVCKKKGWDIIR